MAVLSVSIVFSIFCLTYANVQAPRVNSDRHSLKEKTDVKKTYVLVLAVPGAGHLSPLLAVGEQLVRTGHNVTFITTDNEDAKQKIPTKIRRLGMTYVSAGPSVVARHLSLKDSKTQSSVFNVIKAMTTYLPQEFTAIMESASTYLSGNHVDIIVGEDFLQPALLCLGTANDIKTVIVGTTFQIQPHSLPSWPWPGLVAGAMSDNLSFLDRLYVTVITECFRVFFNNVLVVNIMKPLQHHCPSVTASQVSMAAGVYIPHIVPTVIGFEYPRTISPLTSYVGPLLSRSPDPLTAEIKDWLDGKEEQSVVYVSMGSHVSLTREKGEAILNGVFAANYSLLWSLRQLNQDILDGLVLDDDLTHISGWVPQLSVLGHRAIRLAIVHGGMNGIHEALYNEVPVIVLPVNGDQKANAGRVHYSGLGIHLKESNITSAGVQEAIKQVDEHEIRENIERLKKSFTDAGGVERVEKLIEFYHDVGYDHLTPAYAKYNWSWVQYYNVDVLGTLLVVTLLLCFVITKCCRCVVVSCLRKLLKYDKDKKD